MSDSVSSTPAPEKSCCSARSGLLKWAVLSLAAVTVGYTGYSLVAAEGKKVPDQVSKHWNIHDMTRPKPVVVTPGTFSSQETPGIPPSDAIVLFDGKDLSKWNGGPGKEPAWKVENGYFEVAPGKGNIETKEAIGDMQLHIEWAAPSPAKGNSQGRGNSGVYLMQGRYEIQVLDTFENDTYADGGATAVYGQNPPLVNACRKPGEWQTYDIIWRGPRFDKEGKVTREATVTVLHNGVLTQDHYRLTGGSGHYAQPPYKAHPEALPIQLQNHGDPVRFRNIWYRPLPQLGERNNKIDWTDNAKAPEAASKP